MAQFPSKEVAQLSYDYRTLGLGYANLGSMLMIMGIPYDSEEARGIAGAITAIMTGVAYRTSAEMAGVLGAFPRYEDNKENMLRVMRNHRLAAYDADEYEGLEIKPQGLKAEYCPDYLLTAATKAWDEAVQLGEKYGYRNAQATVIAPTGTIGLVMDCDTTGVEPDFALVKFKKLSGGGYFKIINQSVPTALKTPALYRPADRYHRQICRRVRHLCRRARYQPPVTQRKRIYRRRDQKAGCRRRLGLRDRLCIQCLYPRRRMPATPGLQTRPVL